MVNMYNPQGSESEIGKESGTSYGSTQSAAQQAQAQSAKMGQKVSSQVNKAMRGTASGLEKTSERINSVATYFREKDTDSLVSDLGDAIRRNPGTSLLLGAFVGFMAGRMIR